VLGYTKDQWNGTRRLRRSFHWQSNRAMQLLRYHTVRSVGGMSDIDTYMRASEQCTCRSICQR
jgi:hypothetical protein